jgi:large subunit ribosomal protein L18
MRTEKKLKLATRRHLRVRQKVHGTAERPRMSACFTGKHIYVQFVDDLAGRTLASASTRQKAPEPGVRLGANTAGAKRLGQLAAEVARRSGIERVVFDRGSSAYHGAPQGTTGARRRQRRREARE